MLRRLLFPALFAAACVSGSAGANELEQRFGGYQDDRGNARQRAAFAATIRQPHDGAISATTWSLGARRDRIVAAETAAIESTREDAARYEDALDASFSQAWGKLTETRQAVGITTRRDEVYRTGGVGVSRWIRQETVRLSLDASRAMTARDAASLLDADQEIVELPGDLHRDSFALAVRHLATPTTIVDYRGAYVLPSNRAAAAELGLAVKQFVPPLDGAVHAGATRYEDLGEPTLATSYGRIAATAYDVAWLQELWRGAQASVGYRYYREDETTRATKDRLTFGSDTVTIGLAQKLGGYVLGAKLLRYLANSDGAAPLESRPLGARAVEINVNALL